MDFLKLIIESQWYSYFVFDLFCFYALFFNPRLLVSNYLVAALFLGI
jgi:hypothetical protein